MSQSLPHALLMSGERGLAKYQFALALAQLILCDTPSEARACGQCKACRLNATSHHPDLMVLKRPPTNTVIGIDQIRLIGDWLQTTAHQGGWRVLLIDGAHRLNQHSENALLKILEEPRQNICFILVSDMPYRLLPTVRSRCQHVFFAVPKHEQSVAWLTEHINTPEGEAPASAQQESEHSSLVLRLLEYGGNKPMLAYTMYRDGYPERYQNHLKIWNRFVAKRCVASFAAKAWMDNMPGDELAWLLEWLLECLRFAHATKQYQTHIPEKLEALKNSTQALHIAQINELIIKSMRARALALGPTNPNMRLLIESLLVDCLASIVRNQSDRAA